MSRTTIRARLQAFQNRATALAAALIAVLGWSLLGMAQAGSACTTVYGTRLLNGAGSVVYYNPVDKSYKNLLTTTASDINATAVDPTTGRLYYVDRTTNTLYYFDPQTGKEVTAGTLSRLPSQDYSYTGGVSPIIVGASFDASGNLYIIFSTLRPQGGTGAGAFVLAQVTTSGQVVGTYRQITANDGFPIYNFSNSDLVTDSAGQTWLVAEAASTPGQPRLYKLDLGTAVASASKVINVGGTALALNVNGVAYDPVINQYYINAGDPGSTSNQQGIYALNTSDASVSRIVDVNGITDLGSCGKRPDAPTLSKAFSPTTLSGTPNITTLTLSIGNTNPLPIYLTADLVDSLPASPAQMTIAATPALGGTCLSSTGITANNKATAAATTGTSLTLQNGAVIPPGGCTLQVSVSAPQPGVYTNNVAAGALNTTVGKNPSPATATLTVKSIDVKIEKSGPVSAAVATPFSFTLTASSIGEVDASSVVTTDVLPAQLSFLSADNGGSYDAATRTITWPKLTTLAVGAKQVYTVTVFAQPVSANTSVINTAKVAAPLDSVPGNNTAQATVALVPSTPTIPVSGTCTVTAPYVQSFNTSGPLAEVRNHVYLADGNTVTTTDGSYTQWDQIDNTGNKGYALYYNIANFENKNGGTLGTPGLLYESQINVPAGATISYENYVRTHVTGATQVQYRFYDGVSGTLLQSYDGAAATTTYSKQSVPSFTVPSTKLIVRLYTLKDGTTADANVLKLDDIKVTCPVPTPPTALSIVKTHAPATLQAGQQGTYTLTVSNASGKLPSSGTLTVVDTLPTSAGIAPVSGFKVTSNGLNWTCSYADEAVGGYLTSGQTVTCTTTDSLAAGASSAISFPVTLLPDAPASIVNAASVSGGGDPFNGGKPATGASCDAAHCASDTAPVNPLPAPPATCTTGTTTNLLATPNTTGYSDRDDGSDSYPAALIAGSGGYRQGVDASGAFILDMDWWFNNGVTSPSRSSILSLYVNGSEYARVTGNDGLGGAAQLVGLNGASVSENWLNRGYYKGVYPKLRSYVTLPASVTQVLSIELRFTGGNASAAGSGPSDDFGFNLRALNACTKPVSKLTVIKTVQNITANGPVGTSSSGKPGDVLEYCVTTTNVGTASATKLGFSDTVPANTNAQSAAYGAGKDIQVTTPAGTSYLTFAADTDSGQLGGGAISVSLPTLILAPTQTFSVCFRAAIN
ncbi:hypothetical protein [Deinococcus sp.]|uniref:DUF7933 domain-containing protein n=1 Tax=Deinococcus sp. TaxID=47478 RepID=UPI003CC56E18